MLKPNNANFGSQVCVQQTENGMIPLLYMENCLANFCIAVRNPYKQASRRASDERELGRWCVIQDKSPYRVAPLNIKKYETQNFLIFSPSPKTLGAITH